MDQGAVEPILCEETFAKVIRLVYEDERQAVVIIEDSMGLITVLTHDYGPCAFTWAHPKDFEGCQYFEDFLARKSPQWITSELLKSQEMQIDLDRTRTMMEIMAPHLRTEIDAIMVDLASPLASTTLLFQSEPQIILEDYLGEPLMDCTYFQQTDHAIFLSEFVIPDMLRKISLPEESPPTKTSQHLS